MKLKERNAERARVAAYRKSLKTTKLASPPVVQQKDHRPLYWPLTK